jgi:glycosyltransferase involved in cell wall biosynthesis
VKIILVNHRFDHFSPQFPSSPGIVLYEYCHAAIGAGDEPIVISSPGKTPPHAGIRVEFVEPPAEPATRVAALAARARRRMRGERYLRQAEYIRRVASAVRRIGPSGVPIITNGDPDLAVALAEIFHGSPVVNVFHHHEVYKPVLYERFRRGNARLAAVSGYLARRIEADAGLAAGGVATVYNGVDLVAFSPASASDSGMPPVVNYHGHVSHDKGVDILLDAAEELALAGKSFGLQIVGKENNDEFELTGYERALQSRVASLRKAGLDIWTPGWVERGQLPAELRKAHIHVVPSRVDEGFGMATLEGMACGLATVASNTGGTPEVLGDAGFLFGRGNVEELASHLEKLILDGDLRRQYATKARQRAQEFTWGKTWAGIREVITR